MNGYSLTKEWFDFARNNLDKVDCKHTATYIYIVELFNLNQWVDVLGLPTDYTMASLNIKSYKTYKKIIDDLESFEKIVFVERSKNMFTSNKIKLVKNTKANTKAKPLQSESYDKASQTQGQSDCTIYKLSKLLNIETIKLINANAVFLNDNLKSLIPKKTENEIDSYPTFEDFWNLYEKKTGKEKSQKLWAKIKSQEEKDLIIKHIPLYKISQPEKKYRKNPETYLNNKSWNDEIINQPKQNSFQSQAPTFSSNR